MTTAKLNVLFRKIQKDDIYEVLMFQVQGDELPHANEILKMRGFTMMLKDERK
ncbi:hypothetical protein [Peribacillus sp. NPDC097895]|uniref:hypothetical protein n=1 Tax=Peribacillus sp. NPDC097895 TaxID=3390619 RepID=UPI003CFD931F